MLQSILRRIPQLADGGIRPLAKLDIELHGPHAVFVRIHELSPVSPSFRPYLRGVSFSLRLTVYRPEVRQANSDFIEQGWTDAIRHLHPDERIYTFL
jgi:hypothetical protein